MDVEVEVQVLEPGAKVSSNFQREMLFNLGADPGQIFLNSHTMVVLPGPETPRKWVKIAPKVLGHFFPRHLSCHLIELS